ncbi:GDSL-type esterase/lipase family protein [Paenibacillus sp. 23TSA30-6]|uniref:GDSL-type esterase/lipase family protein n=1 Tax=Paenibacillus sp. 23TSA30-6 TaxID=2546104 RepID=UPI0017880B11|nr:GDSL-type esterase/lipase family protein [Paenibacillus sp. 23TSA30-6]MBE0335781.1 lysophospholipase [Paenibacillus sp. 23TSA30-6]
MFISPSDQEGTRVNSSKWIWRSVGSVSIAATLLLLYGFIAAVQSITAPEPLASTKPANSGSSQIQNAPSAATQAGEFRVAAIGDSLAKGTGDDSGSGFVRRSVTLLNDQEGHKAQLINNLGINGLTTQGLLTKLDEPGVAYVLKKANVIIVSIGGNDLFQGAQAAQTGKEPPTLNGLRKALPDAAKRLQKVLTKVGKINPKAKIIYVGLYNPFSDLPEMKIPGNLVVTEWNLAAMAITNQNSNMTLIPTFDLFQQNLPVYLSSDHFHPNGQGYQAIAERIAQGFAVAAAKEGDNTGDGQQSTSSQPADMKKGGNK